MSLIFIFIHTRNEEDPLYNILQDKEYDTLAVNGDYEIPLVTTDIPVISCPAYATTTFTETEVKID